MITIITGTNRPDSNSSRVTDIYRQIIERQGNEAAIFSLIDLPSGFGGADTFGATTESFEHVLNDLIRPVERFVFVVPEYNGSYPGILKVFLDTVEPGLWAGKKAALAGVATGRSGNQRGLDHLTAVLHYLQMEVLSTKTLLSSIHRHISEEGDMENKEYINLIDLQMRRFIGF